MYAGVAVFGVVLGFRVEGVRGRSMSDVCGGRRGILVTFKECGEWSVAQCMSVELWRGEERGDWTLGDVDTGYTGLWIHYSGLLDHP